MTRNAIERADPLIVIAAAKNALSVWARFRTQLFHLPGMAPFNESDFLSWLKSLDPEYARERTDCGRDGLGQLRSFELHRSTSRRTPEKLAPKNADQLLTQSIAVLPALDQLMIKSV
jgi:hypothetical protein